METTTGVPGVTRPGRWPVAVGLTGLALLVFPGYHLVSERPAGPELVIGVAVPVLLSLSLVAAAVWFARSGIRPAHQVEVGARAFFGLLAMTVAAGLVVAHDLAHGTPVVRVDTLLGLLLPTGTLVGFVSGVPAARSRERAEELRRREARFRTIVEHVDEVVWVLSPDLSTVRYVSPGFEDIWGDVDPESLSLSEFDTTVHPDDRAALRSLFDRVAADHEQWSLADGYEAQFRVETDAGERWLRLSMHPVIDDGRVSQFVGLTVDLTDQRETQRELESATEQLTMLNRLVRHDIRNDLSVVTGWLELAREEGADAVREPLDRAIRRTAHALELTDEVGDVVELVRADAEIDVHAVDLERILREEVERTRETYPAATVEVEGSIPAVTVSANAMLSSVFRNLLSNAVEHSDREAPTVTVSARVDDDRVAVTVADDGPGVPPEIRAGLTDPGTKGLGSSGLGLGLYLVSRLVDAYGGSLSVGENDPCGARFTVELRRGDDADRLTAGAVDSER